MNKVITSVFALFIGIFTLVMGLLLAIPLTIVALITGKKIQKSLKEQQTTFMQRDINQTPFGDKSGQVIEGEYDEVKK
ncbi:hypothetical protein DZ860_01220 [Vibrio sinensis]|uniref:Hydroxylamine reductase n=1 Tax=Vibrio sinensis TaxID=2302434 RepID=A0A3A6RDY2_9VIBR|nr:hypothetical protein [Vibrio sinensis]RJX75332.1 hypothetical protein DZ860_01220 [Vibrio sinensis]